MGQVDELVITGTPDTIEVDTTPTDAQDAQRAERSHAERTADELIVKARQTAARITVVQDASLLAGIGGVGALLRFKL
jgi:peptide subunit release factor 1 (eRF1)